MGIQQIISKNLSDKKKISLFRYSASQILFIFLSLVFFINYFFVATAFGDTEFFLFLLPVSYSGFVISLALYSFFALKHSFKSKIPLIIGSIVIGIFIIVSHIILFT